MADTSESPSCLDQIASMISPTDPWPALEATLVEPESVPEWVKLA